MIVRIHSHGAGLGSGPTGYLMGSKDHAGKLREVAPEVLQGDPSQTRELIDSLNFKRKYTSGVLSFSEPNIKPELKQKIMDSWEYALFPGMDKNQYSILWVEHRDKGRLELNFVIPNVELQTGKRLQPYFDKADRNRIDAWQTMVNAAYDFTDPHEPERAAALSPSKKLPKERQEAAEAITNGLLALGVENRAQVITALSDAGFEVVRQNKNSISIKDPDGGKNLRLKGALYAENYRGGKELRAAREEAERSYRASSESRIREACSRFEKGIEIRRDFLAGRYKPTQTQALDARSIERASIDRTNNIHNSVNERRMAVVRVRERASISHTDNDERWVDMVTLPDVIHRQGNKRSILSNSEISHEPESVRANTIKRAESARRRATERTRSNELHATADRPISQVAFKFSELASRFQQSSESLGRVIETINTMATAINRAFTGIRTEVERRIEERKGKKHGFKMSPWP